MKRDLHMNRLFLVTAAVLGWFLVPPEVLAQRPDPTADGWRVLFNGKDLSGWRGAGDKPGAGWVVENGTLIRKARSGDLWTRDRFGDFVLELEFRTKGNSGILFRKQNPKSNAKDRLEIQLLPPVAKPNKHSCGALYDCLAPVKEACKKDDWNRLTLTSTANRVTVVLNGEKVLDADLTRWPQAGKNPDGTKNKFKTSLKDFPREGHIGFQDHGAEVHFRSIRIKRAGSKNGTADKRG
jgi:3-keto-disaccharide hydrolase